MYKVRKIQELMDDTIHPELLVQLTEVKWRLDSKKYEELFIATKDSVVTGIAMSWFNDFHPMAKYIQFFALEPMPALLESLLQSQKKVVFSCWEDEQSKIKMAEQAGFQLFRQTYMATFSIAALLAKLENIQAIPQITALAQILQHQREPFFSALKRNYEETHIHNPAQNFSWQEWEEFLFDDEVDTELSGVLVEDEQITGYIMLHAVTEKHYEIGWVGQSGEVHIQALLKRQLLELQKKGIQTVEIEVDTTDWHARALFRFIDLQQVRSWNSYILEAI
ncbi:hypothetical protein R6U77_06635 [Lysinibacillus louembei]|uniref:GNAT family N-acetyltransferase n=1 Tax=Lysinibacillus louembei TaxID=1470088 RepID=A0ABZ0RYM5_9BACI|nr:hypothetical protein [Lysinibacillus louembei]WPK13347.1 hypothetical protein R6U77_06635 [Lysinibacillus louembei]